MTSWKLKWASAFSALMLVGSYAMAQTVNVRVMETTDIHVHLMNYDYYQDKASDSYGLVKTATLIGQARSEVKNSLLFDNGDLLQGNPLGDYVAKGRGLKFGEIHPVYKAMNLLGYDAANIGNHEFNYGLGFLGKALHGANFPYVSSNVYVDDGDNNPDNDLNYFQPYVILDKKFTDEMGKSHMIRVGVIGFVPPQITVWDQRHLDGKVIAKDIVESAKKFIPQMRAEGADLVVAIPHSGLNSRPAKGMDENAAYYLSQVPGIDALLLGHSHSVFPGDRYKDLPGVDLEKGTINGVATVMPGFWGGHLGVVDLTVERQGGQWKVTDSKSEARSIFKREGRKTIPLVDSNPLIEAAVQQDHNETLDYMRQKLGESVASINSYFSLVQDDPSVQLVNIAQKWYLESIVQGTELDGYPILSAGAPFKAGGRGGPEYFTDIPPGTIALKNVADLYIYPNDFKVVMMNGAEIQEWLERSAGIFNQIDPKSKEEQSLFNQSFPSYNFDVIDGVTYEIDVTEPSKFDPKGVLINADANRIKNLMYDGKPIDKKQQFLIATNNYRAGGGGHFPGLDGSKTVIDAPDKNRDIIANYFLSQPKIDPAADGNWSFSSVGDWANVVFETSPNARALVEAHEKMDFVRVAENGFVIAKIKL